MPKKTTKITKKPPVKPQPTTTSASQVVILPPMTESQKIWEAIRYRAIDMFALPNQIVEQHCTPHFVDSNRLFLTTRSTATLPSLEAACGKEFVIELADKYLIVSRAPATFALPKNK